MNRSIIFHLDDGLKVYELGQNVNCRTRCSNGKPAATSVSSKNPSSFKNLFNSRATVGLVYLASVEPMGRALNLAERFEAFWQTLDQQGVFQQVVTIYLWLGPQAGFTDTRIVFIWIKTWQMFTSWSSDVSSKQPKANFFTLKLASKLDLTRLDGDQLQTLMTQATANPGQLAYSAEPRIGPSV